MNTGDFASSQYDRHAEYFASLYARHSEATAVRLGAVKTLGWKPKPNDCHRNVELLVESYPNLQAVHGWLICGKDETGRCMFIAHSVLEERGELVDITPIDSSTSRDGLVFLRHIGTDEEFDALKNSYSSISYPPFSYTDMQSNHAGATAENYELGRAEGEPESDWTTPSSDFR